MGPPDKRDVPRAVVTGDGTVSVHSPAFGEAMHSRSGAWDEAVNKHVVPSGILECTVALPRVLDVGFGIGYNVLALADAMYGRYPGRPFEVTSLEESRDQLEVMRSISFGDRRDRFYQALVRALEKGGGSVGAGTIRVITGDGRRGIQGLPGCHFNAIFHDPYSPAKNPELWTVEFFRELYRVAADGCMVTTYSSALQVRSAMAEAGFSVGRGPSVGGKREGTVACRGPVPGSIVPSDLRDRRGRWIPYRDPDFAGDRESILSRRVAEMAAYRSATGHPPVHRG